MDEGAKAQLQSQLNEILPRQINGRGNFAKFIAIRLARLH